MSSFLVFISSTNDNFFLFSLGFQLSEHQNPADYLVKNLAIMPGKEAETTTQSLDVCERFENSVYSREMYDYMAENTADDVSLSFFTFPTMKY